MGAGSPPGGSTCHDLASRPCLTAHLTSVIALPAAEGRVPDVRHFPAAALSQWATSRDGTDSVLLIVGEMAADSARHEHADLTVLLASHGGVIDIEVTDSGPARGHRATASGDVDEHGRGLQIVAALADRRQTHRSSPARRVEAGVGATNAVSVPRSAPGRRRRRGWSGWSRTSRSPRTP
ncbi:ATP-binding protein [Streptomyces sp. NPDC057438]|uniref:ATP-binding protein n=1 Tax=Streptomyces sp. NPDC057438 TaxID=3346133 RepID=UPI0036C2AA45